MQVLTDKTQKFKKGDLIFQEGDEGKYMYIISSGEVEIFKQRGSQTTILAALKREDFFGEMSVFTGMDRSASAIANTNCELQVVSRETFKKQIEDPVIWRLLQKMSDRLLEFDNKVVDLLVEDELAKMIQLFRRYVATQVVDKILHNSEKNKFNLSGEVREVSVLFADIRDFTTYTEKKPPREVVKMLNKYLGQMTQIIFRYDGTVDKYIGDCVMALFNAPTHQKDHAELAVKSGWQILQQIKKMKKENQDIAVGIGINSGRAVLGNIGTDLHLDYTVIGDAVNVASRLCRVAAPDELLISEQTYELIKDKVDVEELGERKFKGKSKPVKIYNIKKLSME